MKNVIRAIAITSLFSTPLFSLANAEEVAEKKPLDPSNFSYKLKLQARFAISDTSKKNAFDVFTQTARFGLNYRYKNVYGEFNVQGGSASSAVTPTSVAATTSPNQSTFVVRKALITTDLYMNETSTVSLAMGRDRLSYSIMYSPDGLTFMGTNSDNASSSSSIDGLGLKYKGKHSFGTLSAGVGYYYNSQVVALNTSPFSNSTQAQQTSTFGAQTPTQSRAMAAYVSSDVTLDDSSTVEVRAMYQSQPKAVTGVDGTKTVATGRYTARDLNSVEASVGYNYNKGSLVPGVWYTNTYLGASHTSNGGTSNDVTYTLSGSDSQTIQTVGAGVNGNSQMWEGGSYITSGDMLTYAAGYQQVSGQKFSNVKVNFSQMSASVGYKQSYLTLDLNYVQTTADTAVYFGTDGVQDKKTHSLIYLASTISL